MLDSAMLDRLRLLAGVGAACSLLAFTGTATSQAATCKSPGEPRSASIARADHPDGTSEVTEFLAGGEYRVTHCGANGRVRVSQTVSPIADPDGGVTLVPTETEAPGVSVAALYGDPSEPSWATAFRGARAALRAAVIAPTLPASAAPAAVTPTAPGPVAPAAVTPTAPGPAAPAAVTPTAPGPAAPVLPGSATAAAPGAPDQLPPSAAAPPGVSQGTAARAPRSSRRTRGGQVAQAAVAGDACTNAQYTPWLSTWVNRTYAYRVNRERFNYNDTSVASIVDGHRNWDTTYNSCGLNDITNLTSQYLGSTSASIHTYPDGQSITDKGDLASVGCAGALACTWLFSNGAGASTETDQRFNENITFTNVGAAGAYDYESIATHESGHSIGLNHANSSDALSMYYAVRAGTTYARSLAKGDVVGLRTRYP